MSKTKHPIIEYRNYNLPLDFPLVLLTGEHWKISDIPSAHLHFHNCLEIGICHSESGIMKIMGETYAFQAGDITVLPKNVPHTTYSDSGKESLWSYLFIDPRELFRGQLPVAWKNVDLMPASYSDYRYILNRSEFPYLYDLVSRAIQELSLQAPHYRTLVKGLLLSLYIYLYRLEIETDAGRDDNIPRGNASMQNALTIAPALDYVEDHYMQPFTIENLADLCGWSPTHFRRVFNSIMGISPLEFVNNTRIMKSCTLLRNSKESILDISGMVGFRSISSFNRCFFKTMQMSPRDYRKHLSHNDNLMGASSTMELAGWMLPD